jgi:hypothetical protein
VPGFVYPLGKIFLCLDGHASDLVVNEDTSAMFAGNDLFALTYFQLDLWRDLVKTTSTGITLDRHQCKTIPVIIPDPVICLQQAFIDEGFSSLCILTESLSSFSVFAMIDLSSSFF